MGFCNRCFRCSERLGFYIKRRESFFPDFFFTIYDMGIQGVRKGRRVLQGVTRVFKGLRGVTRGYKGLQGVTRCYKG